MTISFGAFAEEGDLSGDEIDEIFDDVNHGSDGQTSAESSGPGDLEGAQTAAVAPKSHFNDSMPAESAGPRENVDDDEDAADEINNTVGDSLTESNSFQSYTPEPEVTADRFIRGGGDSFRGSSDPGSFNYEAPKKKRAKVSKAKAKAKKKITKKSSKGKKVAKATKSKSKSRKVASAKKSKNKRYR